MSNFGTILPASVTLTSGKTTFSTIHEILNRGAQVEILHDEGDGWLRVRSAARHEGFIMGQHVARQAQPTPPPAFTPYTVEVVATDARLRGGPGTQFPIIGRATTGQAFEVVGQIGEWLEVRNGPNANAFIAAQLTSKRLNRPDAVRGYLIERPDLMNADLVPLRQISTDGLERGKRPYVAATVWNQYGGLIGLLADTLRIPLATMVAVIAAESSGKPFSPDNRLTIRFEVHIFHRHWGAKNQAIFDRHFQAEGFRNHKWRQDPNAAWVAVHTSQEREHEVLEFARGLDDTSALLSISMGLGQVMGFNFRQLGYESVQEMFETMSRSVHAQILGIFDFVTGTNGTSPAIQALQSGDLLGFATIYNGSGNALTYEGIMEDYVAIFNGLIQTAVEVPRSSTQRGPSEEASRNRREVELFEAMAAPLPESAPTLTPPPSTPIPPPQAETLAQAMQQINVRAQPSTQAAILMTAPRGATFPILEPLEQALAKMRTREQDGQFIQVQAPNGQTAYVAAWLTAPLKRITPPAILSYLDSLPKPELPAGYHALWSQQARLGLPDPFDVLPVAIQTQDELVNMQVNGYGPNTFAFWNWAKWYSRVGGMHNGYDFIVKTGTPLLAVSDGVVIKGWTFMANRAEKTIVLWCFLPDRPEYRDAQGRRMMSNVLVAYGHMSNNALRQHLEVVKAGDVIGLSGTPAGTSTNDHLHYEVHLLQGDENLPNPRAPRKLLKEYDRPQPLDNNTPWNPLLFYSPRAIAYSLHQGQTVGFLGKYPEYPTLDMLRGRGIQHLPTMTPLTLAYYRYGIPVIWNKPKSGTWPEGVVTTDMLPERLKTYKDFAPYPADFLK